MICIGERLATVELRVPLRRPLVASACEGGDPPRSRSTGDPGA